MVRAIDKLNLTDVSFLIPIRIESVDRYRNLLLVIRYLTLYTNTHILILEADVSPKISSSILKKEVEYCFVVDSHEKFHRTHYINQLAMKAITPYICICDADIIIPIKQLEATIDLLRKGDVYVLPYNGSVIFTKEEEKQQFIENCDPCVFDIKIHLTHVCGGAIFMNRDVFMQFGMSNEKITSWGPDDVEQKKRVEILGGSMSQTAGVLYHLAHSRGQNSTYEDNKERIRLTGEYIRIASMNQTELKNYIASWDWVHPKNLEQSTPLGNYYRLKQSLGIITNDCNDNYSLLHGQLGIALAYFMLSKSIDKEATISRGLVLLETIYEKIKSGVPDDEKVMVAWGIDFMYVHFNIPRQFNVICQKIDSWLFEKLMTSHITHLSMPDGALAIAYYYYHLLSNKRACNRYDPLYYQEQLIFVTDEIYELLLHDYQLEDEESYAEWRLKDMGQAMLLMDKLSRIGINVQKVEKINTWLWETVINYLGNRERFCGMDVWLLFAVLWISERSHNWYLLKKVTEWCKIYTSQCEIEKNDECTMNIQKYLWKKTGNKESMFPVSKSICGILCELKIANELKK